MEGLREIPLETGVERESKSGDLVRVSDSELDLLKRASTVIEEAERSLGSLRSQYLKGERELMERITQSRAELSVILEFVSERHLNGAEGHWKFSLEAGGFTKE